MNSTVSTAALLILMGLSALNQPMQAAPADSSGTSWNASRIQAESLLAARRPNEAAAATIQALQGMQKSSVTDNDPNARKLILEDVPDIVTGLVAGQHDYNNAETLCKWAISACTARFGEKSPVTAMSYSPLITVYSMFDNTVTPNRDQKKKDTVAKREQIRTSLPLAQQNDYLKMSLASMRHSQQQLDGRFQQLDAAKARLDQTLQRAQETLKRVKNR